MKTDKDQLRLSDGTLLGTWLATLRQEQGWSLHALARNAGIDGGNLSRIENNRIQPTIQTVISICIALDISLDTLTSKFDKYNVKKDTDDFLYKQKHPFMGVVWLSDIFDWLDLWFIDTEEGEKVIASLIHNTHDLDLDLGQGIRFPVTRLKAVDIPTMLSWSPIYQFSVMYPPFHSQHAFVQQLESTTANGSYLVKEDIKAFVGAARSVDQIDLPDRIKFADVLRISTTRHGSLELINLYWHLIRSTNAFNDALEKLRNKLGSHDIEKYQWVFSDQWTEYVSRLSITFLYLCRWQQFASPVNDTWLTELRRRLDRNQN
ncbi:helix-turn-helix transcriptional regulator [Chloroflexales bacterium ZM16-3]|nr:helix-turn-helix transcriptional regulator [Chloroflexales bacterium ZM16-3]